MPIPQIITLSPVSSALLMAFFLFLVFWGRVEVFVALQLMLAHSTRTLLIFGVGHIWPLIVFIPLSFVVYWLRRKEEIRWSGLSHGWIIPWMIVWWIWIVFLFYTFRRFGYSTIYFVINVILIASIVFIFSDNLSRVRIFGLTYLIAAVGGGVLALDAALGGRPFSYLFQDPTLLNTGAGWFRNRIPTGNYHFFAMPFIISLVLAWIFFEDVGRRWLRPLFLLAMAFCVYMIVLASSRIGVLSAGIVLMVISMRYLNFRRRGNIIALLLIVVVLVLAALFYQSAPAFFLEKGGSATFLETITGGLEERLVHDWGPTLGLIARSPLWGTGFWWELAHNLYLGTLAEQGVVGFVFLIGWLVFAAAVLMDMRRGVASQIVHWQQGMLLIAFTTLVAGLVNGSVTSFWHLFWSVVIAWRLQNVYNYASKTETPLPVPAAKIKTPRYRKTRQSLPIPSLHYASLKREARGWDGVGGNGDR